MFGCPRFVASGYAEDPVMANPKEYGFSASICKPFSKDDLAKNIERTFEASNNTERSRKRLITLIYD